MRISLAEFQATTLPLTPSQVDVLQASELVKIAPAGAAWLVKAAGRIGSIWAGDLQVRVYSKLGPVKVLHLMARAQGLGRLHLPDCPSLLGPDAPISAALAFFFEHQARISLADQPPWGYRSQDQTSPVVRGRIRLLDQARRRYDQSSPIEITADDWTADTADNRHLLAATAVLLQQSDLPAATTDGLRRVRRLLRGLGVEADRWAQTSGRQRTPAWTPTPLNARLHPLLRLADLALTGLSVEHTEGTYAAAGFSVSMPTIFELFLAQVISDLVQPRGFDRIQWHHTMIADHEQQLTMKPDLLMSRAGQAVAVLDAKYAQMPKKEQGKNEHIYQVLAYCAALAINRCHLIYADQRPPVTKRHTMRVGDLVVQVHTVDLTDPLPIIEAKLAASLNIG